MKKYIFHSGRSFLLSFSDEKYLLETDEKYLLEFLLDGVEGVGVSAVVVLQYCNNIDDLRGT